MANSKRRKPHKLRQDWKALCWGDLRSRHASPQIPRDVRNLENAAADIDQECEYAPENPWISDDWDGDYDHYHWQHWYEWVDRMITTATMERMEGLVMIMMDVHSMLTDAVALEGDICSPTYTWNTAFNHAVVDIADLRDRAEVIKRTVDTLDKELTNAYESQGNELDV